MQVCEWWGHIQGMCSMTDTYLLEHLLFLLENATALMEQR